MHPNYEPVRMLYNKFMQDSTPALDFPDFRESSHGEEKQIKEFICESTKENIVEHVPNFCFIFLQSGSLALF